MRIDDQLTHKLSGQYKIPGVSTILEYCTKRFNEKDLMYYMVRAAQKKNFNALDYACVHNAIRSTGDKISNFMILNLCEALALDNTSQFLDEEVQQSADIARRVLGVLSSNALPLQLIGEGANESDKLRRKIETIKDVMFSEGHAIQGQNLEDALSGLDQVDNELEICRSYFELQFTDDDIEHL